MPEDELATDQEPINTPESMKHLAIKWHNEFDNEIWQRGHETRRAAYHNQDHIQAVQEMGKKYLQQIDSDEDPLGVLTSINDWNSENPGDTITPEDVQNAFEWAAIFHDSGNIISSVENVDGVFIPNYLDKYTSKGAEQRSIDIAKKIILQTDIPTEEKDKLTKLSVHMIGETTYDGKDPDRPFAVFMRVMDQIASAVADQNERRIEGLLEEMIAEDPEATANPDDFINFFTRRLDQLIPEDKVRDDFLEVMGLKMPEEIVDLPTQETGLKQILAYVKGDVDSF